MATEIERRFLMTLENFDSINQADILEVKFMTQGYIPTTNGITTRVRSVTNMYANTQKAFITIKGKHSGMSCDEFEYEIPYNDGIVILNTMCESSIVKSRHVYSYNGQIFEVDKFGGLNEGLIICEIELESEDQVIDFPSWLDVNNEVTKDRKYSNLSLSQSPISVKE